LTAAEEMMLSHIVELSKVLETVIEGEYNNIEQPPLGCT
jgi:hypothetical protein